MTMLIIHGENIVESRRKLDQEINRFRLKKTAEILRYEGESLEESLLIQNLESRSLFGLDRLVIIENLFSGPKSVGKSKIIDYLKKINPPNVIVWEEKKIDKRVLSPFKAQFLVFDLPKPLFIFLESVYPGNGQKALVLFNQTALVEEIETIFYFLCRHLSQLIVIKDLGGRGLSQWPNWKVQRLIFQADRFELEALERFYQSLLLIDWRNKTGSSPLDLKVQLELLLANL